METKDYSKIKAYCETNSKQSSKVIDDFLIHYAAGMDKLDRIFDRQLVNFNQVAKDTNPEHLNFLRAEFIGHQIFKRNGLIHKYLKHSQIKRLPPDQLEYLKRHSEMPWRFSIASITQNPSDAFFEMYDELSGEEYFLYSPGMQTTFNDRPPRIWLILIAFNGQCWQTFGLILPFQSFSVDDIFFFATELNPQISNEEMISDELESNPIPFFMLLNFSVTPVLISRDHEIVYNISTEEILELNTEKLKKDFTVSWNNNIYRLELKDESKMPHFATAYYDEIRKILIRSAMTEHGFDLLTNAFKENGYDLTPMSDILVRQQMLTATEKILKREIELNPYEKLFSLKTDKKDPMLEKVNKFLGLAIPIHNEGKEVNLEDLANQAGIDLVNAKSVWTAMKENVEKMKKQYPKEND